MRVFFAHPKSWDDDLIDEAVRELAADMGAGLGTPVEVIAGRDDFHANIASEGNFNGWCRSITRRTDQYGKRTYDVVAVPKTPDGIGKATAHITRDALHVRLPVVEVEWLEVGGIRALPVVALDEVDGENYLTGWRLITGAAPDA